MESCFHQAVDSEPTIKPDSIRASRNQLKYQRRSGNAVGNNARSVEMNSQKHKTLEERLLVSHLDWAKNPEYKYQSSKQSLFQSFHKSFPSVVKKREAWSFFPKPYLSLTSFLL
jgi:hypothetical protein